MNETDPAPVKSYDDLADGGTSPDARAIQESIIPWSTIWKPLLLIIGIFLLFFWLPIDSSRFSNAILESLGLVRWYAREHVILCLIPALSNAARVAKKN